MAIGARGRTGAMFSAKVVIRQDTATVTIPHQPTADLTAVEVPTKKGTAMSVLMVWHNASIYAITRWVRTRAVVTLVIKHRHKTGKDVKVSIFFLAEQLLC